MTAEPRTSNKTAEFTAELWLLSIVYIKIIPGLYYNTHAVPRHQRLPFLMCEEVQVMGLKEREGVEFFFLSPSSSY